MPLFWEGRISKLGIFRDHARILHGRCSAVLNEAVAIRTFLLNSCAVQFLALDGLPTYSVLAGNSIWNQWLQRRGLSIGPQGTTQFSGILGFLFRTPVRSDLSFQPAGESWGHASQSAEMPSEMALVGKPRGQGD
jgi:hypothetical protein